jgi:hypothetical protein
MSKRAQLQQALDTRADVAREAYQLTIEDTLIVLRQVARRQALARNYLDTEADARVMRSLAMRRQLSGPRAMMITRAYQGMSVSEQRAVLGWPAIGGAVK